MRTGQLLTWVPLLASTIAARVVYHFAFTDWRYPAMKILLILGVLSTVWVFWRTRYSVTAMIVALLLLAIGNTWFWVIASMWWAYSDGGYTG